MKRSRRIVRHTAEELEAMRMRGEDRTDWRRAAKMTEEEIERAIASDPDEAGMTIDWEKATVQLPRSKALFTLRLDRDVRDWFWRHGKGYQTRSNAVLHSYVEQMERRSRH